MGSALAKRLSDMIKPARQLLFARAVFLCFDATAPPRANGRSWGGTGLLAASAKRCRDCQP